MHNFDMATFYAKYLQDIRRSVREDGALFVQPKNGEKAYCQKCYDQYHRYLSPVHFEEVEEGQIPYCNGCKEGNLANVMDSYRYTPLKM